MSDIFKDYQTDSANWDEMYKGTDVRPHYADICDYLKEIPQAILDGKEDLAKKLFMSQGITFTVYSNKEGIEKIFPFDIIPRIITSREWKIIEAGIKQRLTALNLFLKDIYHQQQIIKDGIIPADIIYSCPHFLREMIGVNLPYHLYVQIAGIDLIRGEDGSFYVLEDNLRTPSGVSYMIENREITKRIFPELLTQNKVRAVTDYATLLHDNLVALSPRNIQKPNIVLLTPGIYNSAYFEHTYLARFMGVELVEGRDLVVDDQRVFMKTTTGLKQVDVIYRRVDDEFLDPLVFRSDSMLGVPGLMSAYRKGNVAIANALGNGVADDKAIYAFVPDMIKYYLNQKPILKNVPTYRLGKPDELEHVLQNISTMVVKKTNESGGYGMLMGHAATEQEIETYIQEIHKNPRNFIAQPTINLSSVPCYIDGKLQPRRVDLRPYALCGPDGIEIVPGGLTRVALKEGSLVVNSSQGGGSKDTWVLDE